MHTSYVLALHAAHRYYFKSTFLYLESSHHSVLDYLHYDQEKSVRLPEIVPHQDTFISCLFTGEYMILEIYYGFSVVSALVGIYH